MANADFSQKQNSTSGGFDAGSYREQKQPEQAVPLTPLQQKLAGLEAKLPATLSTRAAALALSVVVMLAAFLGFGSAKLRSRYNEVRKWYTVGVAADNGYNLNEELTTRMNTAANIITTASSTLGADSAEVQAAQSALSDFTACLEAVQNGGKSQALTSLPYYQGSTMHALYQANEVLGSRIDQLYAKLQEQAADPMKMGAVQGQYSQFNSAQTPDHPALCRAYPAPEALLHLGKLYRRHFLHACLYHPVYRSFLYLYYPSRPLLRLVLGAVWLVRRTALAQRPAPSPRPLR